MADKRLINWDSDVKAQAKQRGQALVAIAYDGQFLKKGDKGSMSSQMIVPEEDGAMAVQLYIELCKRQQNRRKPKRPAALTVKKRIWKRLDQLFAEFEQFDLMKRICAWAHANGIDQAGMQEFFRERKLSNITENAAINQTRDYDLRPDLISTELMRLAKEIGDGKEEGEAKPQAKRPAAKRTQTGGRG